MLGKKLFFIKDFLNSSNFKNTISFEEFMKIYTDDKLTEIINSDIFNDRRNKKSLSLILFKIRDKKKGSVDISDEDLDMIFHTIKMEVRDYDILASSSKDQFLLLLPECSLKNAEDIAKRIASIIENFDEEKRFDINFGVAEYIDGESKESFIQRARDRFGPSMIAHV